MNSEYVSLKWLLDSGRSYIPLVCTIDNLNVLLLLNKVMYYYIVVFPGQKNWTNNK